jgi:hypothetical protein
MGVNRALLIVGVIVTLAVALWVGATVLANMGTDFSLHAPKLRSGSCTPAQPCEIRIAFAATDSAARGMPEGLLDRVARDDVAALRAAFQRSGVTVIEAGEPDIVFVPPVVVERPIDSGQIDRFDMPASWSDPVGFNEAMLRWLPGARHLRATARRVNLAVVFTGMRGPDGACYANAVAGSGYLVIPGCLLDGYAGDAHIAWNHRIMFLHEAGHIFGAFHNDNGDPQPCRDAARSGKAANSCAWEQCLGRACSADQLQFARDAFCTLVGQYNYNRGPDGESFCRAHRGGENGSGWILEYSHPGKCRTPGYEAFDCGDAGHDQVAVMRRQAPVVAGQHPRVD